MTARSRPIAVVKTDVDRVLEDYAQVMRLARTRTIVRRETISS